MNSVKIEKLSINYLEIMITKHPLMQNYINSNDKEPSWDGYIYTYTNKDLKVESIKYKIPVQVKGRNNEEWLFEDEINYAVEYKHLENYYEDGGVCYFVIAISDDGERTAIFFNALTPIKLQCYIEENKNNYKTKNIPLKLIKDKNELYSKLMQFGYDRQKQGSGQGEIIKNSIDLCKIDNLQSIKIKAYGIKTIFEAIERISTGEVCLYGKTSGIDIWRPIKYKQQLGTFLKPYEEIDRTIECGNKTYYSKYIIEIVNETKRNICLSENLKFKIDTSKIDENEVKIGLNFNTRGTLKSISNDLNFINDLLKSKQIYSNKKVFCELKGCDLDFEVDDFKGFQIAEEAFTYFNIQYNKKVSVFKQEDWNFVNIVADIYLGHIPNFEGEAQIFRLEIHNKFIPFYFLKNSKEKIVGYNFLMPKGLQITNIYNDKEYRIPSFLHYKQKDWDCLYEFKEDLLLEEIKKSDFNIVTQYDFSLLFLELLLSYDFNKNETYYNMADLITDKLLEVDPSNEYWKINKFQMLKRKGKLTDEDLNEIYSMEENTEDDMVICAVNILLDNKYKAKRKISELSQEKRKIFMDFPIYNLL